MNYKVGDVVHIRDDLDRNGDYGMFGITNDMYSLRGTDVTINKVLTPYESYQVAELPDQPWIMEGMISGYAESPVSVNVEDYL